MRPFRFMHAADLHLDSQFKGLAGLPDAVRRRMRESTFRALDRMVNIALEERVDFVVIAGDVYDLADRSMRAQLRFQQALEKLSAHGIPVYVAHGNHDPLDGSQARLAWPESARFFPADSAATFIASDKNGEEIAAISGISFGKSAVTDNLAERFPAPRPGLFNIAVLHTNADGDAGHDNYAPCTKEQLVRSGYDYWALGHIHSARVLHESPWIVYSGNIQGRSVRETGAKGCYIVDVQQDGSARLTFHATDDVRWEWKELSIQGWQDEQQLKDGLAQLMEEARAGSRTGAAAIRVTLTGRSPLHSVLHEEGPLQELLAELRDEQAALAEQTGQADGMASGSFVWIESCQVRTGAPIDYEALLAQDSFIGDLLRMAEEAMEDDEAFETLRREATAPLMNNVRAARLMKELSAGEIRSLIAAARELAVDMLLEEDKTGG